MLISIPVDFVSLNLFSRSFSFSPTRQTHHVCFDQSRQDNSNDIVPSCGNNFPAAMNGPKGATDGRQENT